MPIINRVADMHQDVSQWRRDLHANPEILYDVVRTAGVVRERRGRDVRGGETRKTI